MLTMPKIIDRESQPYVAIRRRVKFDAVPALADTAYPLLDAWMRDHGVKPAGPSFFKYNVIDMQGLLEIEVGFPTEGPVQGDDTVVVGSLPAGRYGMVRHTGSYDELYDANAVLIGWAKEKGIRWDAEESPEGDRFACRLESYVVDPAAESDPQKWATEVLIRVR